MEQILINMINNPKELDVTQMLDIINQLCIQKNLKLEYDGANFCQLSGEIIAEKETIKLNTNRLASIVVLKEKLKELILNNCFHNDVLEPAFQRIYNITILNYGNINQQDNIEIPYIDITDEILNQVFTQDELKEIQEKQHSHNQQLYEYPYLDNEIDFICPITKELCFSFSEGINLQGQLFSLDGAIQILETQRDKLFAHQIEYLEISKQQVNQKKEKLKTNIPKNEQNQNDQITFICPQTQKQYFCFEGIKFEHQLYSLEGLIQLYQKSPDIIKGKQSDTPHLFDYIERVRNNQKQVELQCFTSDKLSIF